MGQLIQYMTKASEYAGEWKWQAAGMGYIIVTENRKLIVIDGGNPEDAERFLGLMQKVSGKDKPEIDLWILTHPHSDHFGCLSEIAAKYSDSLTVKKFAWSIPETFSWMLRGELRNINADIQRIKSLPGIFGSEFYQPQRYDTVEIDGTKITFLFTYECAEKISDPNELSMVFTVTGADKKVMITGDSYPMGLEIVRKDENITPDMLKSDIVQTAHHGLNGGNTFFYKAVAADIALVPISVAGNRAMNLPEENCAHNNLYAQHIAQTVIKAFTGTVSLDF